MYGSLPLSEDHNGVSTRRPTLLLPRRELPLFL